MESYCLEVWGDYACFTRPEMKVERVSYDLITPSAARAVFESILWKPGLRWRITRIEVLNPIRWIALRRNEVGAVASVGAVKSAIKQGRGNLGLFVEDERQQRAGLFLRDVRYRLHAGLDVTIDESPIKYQEMFQRRARKGQCFNQPYLGCREFSAHFRLIADPDGEPDRPIPEEDRELGYMLYDLDFADPANPVPRFFRARLNQGVMQVPGWDSLEVRE